MTAAIVRDRVASAGASVIALGVTAVFTAIVIDLARRGLGELSWAYLVTGPTDAGRGGGVAPMLVSSLAVLAICLVTAGPAGLLAAAWLAEQPDAVAVRAVRRSLDVLAGVPSIVFGLFGNAFFCGVLGMGYSLLAGGLTLACMALPLMIRTAEEGLRRAHERLGPVAAATGLSRTTTLGRVLLPAALPAVAAGVVLSTGRALAETAALLFTSGYVSRMPGSVLDSGRTLTIHVYDLAMDVAGGDPRAAAAALVLLALLATTSAATTYLLHRLESA